MARFRYDDAANWYADQAAGHPQAGASLRMETPTRPAGLASDLFVPFGQSVITGALVAGVITFLLGRTEYTGKLTPVWFGLALGIGTICWLFLLVDTRRLLRTIERLTGLDIDGDGTAGTVKERHVLVNAEAARNEAARVDADNERTQTACELAEFVAKLPNVGTDSRTWEPRIGREKYQAFRSVLLEMGWAAWNSQDRRQGWRLVLPTREILARITADD